MMQIYFLFNLSAIKVGMDKLGVGIIYEIDKKDLKVTKRYLYYNPLGKNKNMSVRRLVTKKRKRIRCFIFLFMIGIVEIFS